jgi:hypothetical protein
VVIIGTSILGAVFFEIYKRREQKVKNQEAA